MHHIVSDGWSMGVVAQELAALYDAMGKDPSFAADPFSTWIMRSGNGNR